MRALLSIVSVLVGLANAVLYGMLGDDSFGGPFDWRLPQWPLSALFALSGGVVGLSVSGTCLKFARRELNGGFFSRYGLMVFAICLGGVAMSLLLVLATIAFGTNVIVPSRPSEILSVVAFAAVAGGILGAVEGVVLALPLAGLLGRFRSVR